MAVDRPSDQPKTVEDFAPLLTGADKPLLVGGQAVNVWAVWTRQRSGVERLAAFEPFTSKDCDVFGDRALLARLSRHSGLPLVAFPSRQPSLCIGYLHKPGHPEIPMLEVLQGVRGLTSRDLAAGAMEVELDGKTYRTLSPVTLLKAKLANAHELPQNERQDVRHVKILVICVCAYIQELHMVALSGEVELAGTLKKALRRTWDIISSDTANAVAAKHLINLSECFPVQALKSSSISAVRNFYKHRLEH